MARLLFDQDARQDLRQIVRYIGVEQMRPDAARNVARKIYDECKRYARNPLMENNETIFCWESDYLRCVHMSFSIILWTMASE